ncbi:MAG: hypothetical protein ACRD96_20825 [Bryobacteraceae bacterium]
MRSLFACLAVAVCALAQSGSPVPSVEAIIARMGEARAENRARFRPYKVTRHYKLFGKEKLKPKSHVIADVSFVPPNSKKFAIQQNHGSGLGERIVRQMLEGEAEAVKQYSATDISPANYEIQFLREEEVNGQFCYVLALVPKRKDRNLLRGNIWVDARTYMPHRFIGEPAKAPSWWLRDSRIAFVYGDVSGMWLHTSSESSANVRIFGPYTMTSYDAEYQVGEPGALGQVRSSQLVQARLGIAEPVELHSHSIHDR